MTILKKENLKQFFYTFINRGSILLSKLSKEFRFFYLIYIKRDKSCQKICSNWYIKSIAVSAPTEASEKSTLLNFQKKFELVNLIKIVINFKKLFTAHSRENLGGQKKEINIDWKEKYFDLLKKFRQQYFKFGTTRAVAVFLCIALIITAGWQMIWSASRAAAEASWGFTSAADYTATANVEVDAADNNLARLKSNYTPGTNWIATNGNGYDWKYRQEVSVDNSQAEYDFSNYQLRVALNSDNFDFSIPDSQGNDIRFTGALARTNYATEQERLNAQGTNEISYYRESYDQSGKTAVFWVTLPNIYSFWGVSTENSGTDNKVKVDDISGFPDPADFSNGEIPVTVMDTSNTEANYITAINADTKELTFKNNFANNYLTSLTAQVKYIEDEQIYLYYGNSNATVSTQANMLAETNLAGFWKFEEHGGATTADDSGNNNIGTLKTGSEPTWTAGEKGHALNFKSGRYIELGTSSTLKPSSAITVEFWKKENSLNDAGIYGFTSSYGNGVFIGTWSTGGYYFCLQGVSCTYFTASRSSASWQHIAATYDGQYKRFYINGVKVREEEIVGTIGYPSDGPTVGYLYGGYNYFDGFIDELKVYNRALTVEEILAQYNADVSSSPTYLTVFSTVQSTQSLYPSIWQYQRAITIDNDGGGALTNHQVKISLTSSNFTFAHANSNGFDIRFADSDNTTELNYWIEAYSSVTQTATLWVKVPSISADSTKTIYMYYGNTGADVDQGISSASTRVINGSSLIASWHFDETSGTTAADSSGRRSIGTLTNGPTWVAGKFGNGISFDATNDYIDIPTSDINYLAGSLSVWIKPNWNGNDNTKHAIFNNRNGATGSWVGLYKDSDNYIKINPGGSTAKVDVSSWTAGTWHFVTFTWNNSTGSQIYVDGAAAVSYNGALGLGILSASIQQYIGLVIEYTNYPFDGIIDEVNLFNTALTSTEITDLYNSYGKTLSADLGKIFVGRFDTALPSAAAGSETSVAWPSSEAAKLTVVNNTGQNYISLTSFTQTLTGNNAGSVKYQISNNGTTWYWYNSGTGDWESASGLLQTNTSADVNTYITGFDDDIHPGETGTFYFKAFFISNGTQKVELDSVAAGYIYDTLPPTNPVAATGYSDNGKATSITSGSWYAHTKPYFEFAAATDQADTGNGEEATGVAGYWVYFGTTSTADPEVSGTWINGNTDLLRVYESATLTTAGTYYFRIKSKDNANNESTSSTIFTYKFDNVMPITPTFIAVSPQGYASTDSFTFVWQEATDANSGFNGYCYKTGVTAEQNATLYAAFHSDSRCNNDGKFITGTSITTTQDPDLIHYQNGSNIFYITAKDNAGNLSYPATALYYFSGSAPGPIQNLSVDNTSSTTNAFTFTWDPPASYTGNIEGYYYSINQEPSISNSVWLGNVTSTGAIAAATMQGANNFYIVAKDDASNIDWDSWDPQGKIEFSCTTPGLSSPTQVRLTDASIEYDEIYALTLTWNPITLESGTSTFASYDIYKSTNGTAFTRRASLSDINQDYFTDTNLDPDTTYWYYIISVDNAAKESPQSNSDPTSYQPASQDDTPPELTGGTPVATSHDSYAQFTWTTDEPSDSHVEYGTVSGTYTSMQGNDTQATSHIVQVYGLNSLTTYYYRIRSKDATGNPLISTEYSFTYWPPEVDTSPAISSEQTQSPSSVGTEANITWTTDKYATSQVYYSTEQTELCSSLALYTTEDTTLNKSHMVQLSNLAFVTPYYYCTRSKDTYDHVTWGTMRTFTTGSEKITYMGGTGGGGGSVVMDKQAPTISSILVSSISDNGATISWATNEKATSLLDYGLSSSYSEAKHTALTDYTTSHQITLSNLIKGTVYHYQVLSQDASGNLKQSADATFTTTGTAVVTPIPETTPTPETPATPETPTQPVQPEEITPVEEVSVPVTVVDQNFVTAMEAARQISTQVTGPVLETTFQNFLNTLKDITPGLSLEAAPQIEISATDAIIKWKTNKRSNSQIAFAKTSDYDETKSEPYSQIVGQSNEKELNHNVKIINLTPSTDYYFQIRSKSIIGSEVKSKRYTFTTASQLPEVTNFSIKNISERAATFVWQTNIPTDSQVKYIPYRNDQLAPGEAQTVTKSDFNVAHEIAVKNLEPGTTFNVSLEGKDLEGNNYSFLIPNFTTTKDKNAPIISQIRTSVALSSRGDEVQTIVTWNTDEPSTSQVEYQIGFANDAPIIQMSKDISLRQEHLVVITSFKPGSIYRFKVTSEDSSGNTTGSKTNTLLTPQKRLTVTELIFKNFQQTFGWMKGLGVKF